MKPSVYIETTIISYLRAWPSRDLVRAAQQQITKEWWQRRKSMFDIYASELVAIEASAGDATAAKERIETLQELTILKTTDHALALADQLLAGGALPAKALRDAQHLSIAAVNGIGFLLTWNCTHLANAALRTRIEQVCESAGVRPPVICTPEELMGDWP